MKKNNFYMILPSNSCPLIHPNNKASHFVVEWENPINLQGRWEVALNEFTFIYTSFTILSNAEIRYSFYKDVSISKAVTIDGTSAEFDIIDDFEVDIVDSKRGKRLEISVGDGEIALTFNNIEDAKKLGFNKVTTDYYTHKITSNNAPTKKAEKVNVKIQQKIMIID